MKVALGGGTPVMLATGASAAEVPWDVTVDADAVYWSTYNSPGTVMRAPLAGGTPATLAQGQNGPRNIAVVGASAYWINLWIFGNNTGAVLTAPVAGGTPAPLARRRTIRTASRSTKPTSTGRTWAAR